MKHAVHATIVVSHAENGFVVEIGGKHYCVEGTDEDFLKWWQAYRDNERLEWERRQQAVTTAVTATTAQLYSNLAPSRQPGAAIINDLDLTKLQRELWKQA